MKKNIFKKLLSLTLALIVAVSFCFIPSVSVETKAVTQNQQNMVDRADYYYGITWKAQETTGGWGGTFYKGETYRIPYGQPIYSGKYVGYGVSFEDFLEAASTAGSIFYTGRSWCDGTKAPYYASDCSSFVSWVWGIQRTTTYYIPNYSTNLGYVTTARATSTLQLGDALNSNAHVVLVSGLDYDSSGNITRIEITEQTPPQMKRSYYTPSGLAGKYGSYTIQRYNGSVPVAPNADDEAPVISDVKYSDVSASGYTISCTVKDNVGVDRVAFPTWTVANAQDDLPAKWDTTQVGSKNGDRYTFRVNASDHNNEGGMYATHIYAYDRAGNKSSLSLQAVEVRNDTVNPVISDVRISELSSAGYTVTCKATDDWGIDKVVFPAWTVANNQDDIPANWPNTQLGARDGDTFTFRVNASDHNNEGGYYATHIYAYDCAGNKVCYTMDVNVRNDTENPVISDVVFSEISSEGYKVTCKVTDDWGVNSVAFPTWTVANAQDDLPEQFMKTQLGTRDGDTFTFYVKTADHNNELGYYATHIYAVDCAGNTSTYKPDPIEVKDFEEVEEKITLTSSATYKRDDTFLKAVKASTTVADLLKQFENTELEVLDNKGNALDDTAKVGTGSVINLYNGDVIVDTVTVIISGDVDGNGLVDTTDYMRIKQTFLRNFEMSTIEEQAADAEENGVIDSTDCMRIKSHFLGTYNLCD